MKTIQGRGVVNGVAKGKVKFYQQKNDQVPTHLIKNIDKEWACFIQGRQLAVEELSELYEKLDQNASKEEADILNAHMMMMDDVTLEDLVKEKIEKNR
jgi:phosphotransferase system enzyme I (PtsI)